MTTYDLAEYLCPANGKPLLLSSGENCVCVQCPDGWVEFRKNSLVEEFFVSQTAVGRGADTSDLWRPGNQYTGTFYIQYTKLPDDSLRYGADWAARYMQGGQTYDRVCTIIVYDYLGNQLKRDDDVRTTLVLNGHHLSKTFPTGAVISNVLEFQWGGEERYYYARGFGLCGWENLATGQGNYLASFTSEPQTPVPHAVPRPPYQEQPPVPPVTPSGSPVTMRVTATAGLKLRAVPNGEPVLFTMPYGLAVTGYPDTQQRAGSFQWIVVDVNGTRGWAAATYLQPVAPAFRLRNPVGCASVITSRFGAERDYGIHEGIDLAPEHRDCTPLILNGADGVVMDVNSAGPYGVHIVVSSVVGTQEMRVWFAHLARAFVQTGQQVKAGEYLGVMGSSGNSSGTHLHLSVQKVGAPTPAGSPLASAIDPTPFLE